MMIGYEENQSLKPGGKRLATVFYPTAYPPETRKTRQRLKPPLTSTPNGDQNPGKKPGKNIGKSPRKKLGKEPRGRTVTPKNTELTTTGPNGEDSPSPENISGYPNARNTVKSPGRISDEIL